MITTADALRATEHMAQLFSLAVHAKINLDTVTSAIEHSAFAAQLQAGRCSQLANSTAEELFEGLFENVRNAEYLPTAGHAVYDEAYWCGWAYMQLLFETHMPLPYLFLVLPLRRMMDLYPVYHEMDISQLFDLFKAERQNVTIMRSLLKRHGLKVPELSKRSGVSVNTINHYKKADENLYAASFQNAFRLARALDAPPELFLQQLEQLIET